MLLSSLRCLFLHQWQRGNLALKSRLDKASSATFVRTTDGRITSLSTICMSASLPLPLLATFATATASPSMECPSSRRSAAALHTRQSVLQRDRTKGPPRPPFIQFTIRTAALATDLNPSPSSPCTCPRHAHVLERSTLILMNYTIE